MTEDEQYVAELRQEQKDIQVAIDFVTIFGDVEEPEPEEEK